jgi:GT2 family glycosyltransferase
VTSVAALLPAKERADLARRAVAAAGRELGVEPRVLEGPDELASDEPGVLLLLDATHLREALAAGWGVLTTSRHRDLRHGRELFWVASLREEVLVQALLTVARAGERLAEVQRAARSVATSISDEDFAARFAPPAVSIIIPAFDDEGCVGDAVGSVLRQTMPDLEVVVVDDGSRDRTREVLLELRDPRVVLAWRAGGGPSSARNTGLALARGERYVAFLDSDDRWEPLFLERLVESLEVAPPTTGLAFCDSRVTHDGRPAPLPVVLDASLPALVRSHGLFPTGSFVVRTAVVDRVGPLDPDIERGEDYEWLLRVGAAFDFVRVPEVLHEYRRSSSGQLSQTAAFAPRLDRARRRALEAWSRRASRSVLA